jgi:hypothetical protein
MQMRRTELPGQTYWQRLATRGTAKALRWLFLSLSGAKNRDAISRTLDAGKVDRAVHCSMLIWPAQPHSFWASLAKLFEIADSDAKIFYCVISYLLGVAATLLNVHIAFVLYALMPLFCITPLQMRRR